MCFEAFAGRFKELVTGGTKGNQKAGYTGVTRSLSVSVATIDDWDEVMAREQPVGGYL